MAGIDSLTEGVNLPFHLQRHRAELCVAEVVKCSSQINRCSLQVACEIAVEVVLK